MRKYYSLEAKKDKAVVSIYGDITSYPFAESDVSAFNLSKELEKVTAKTIEVYINSYGGEVAEGLAIYNALKRHKAKVKTYVDGFACSIASVIAMAGDERYMYPTSLLMIHNAWTYASGNSADLRKVADDLDIMTSSSIKAYKEHVNISEEEIKELLDNETWLTADEALEKGFITKIAADTKNNKSNQSARKAVYNMLLNKLDNQDDDEKEPNEEGIDIEELNEKLDNLIDKVDNLISILSEEPGGNNNSEGEPDDEPDDEGDPDDEEETPQERFIKAINKICKEKRG